MPIPVALATHDPGERGPARIVAPPSRPQAAAKSTLSPDDPHPNIQVSGLKGTLNKGDVHQAMEARQADFDRCISQSRRTLRWVSGSIKFAFRVDGEGRVLEVRKTSSSIGHRPLEVCLTETVESTQFPKPAGRATAEFSWGLSVEPAGGKPLDTLNPKSMKSLMRKQAGDLFKTCEIRRRRARFQITAYLANGHLLSAGAVPLPAQHEDKVDCVLEEFAKWPMPKTAKSGKVVFELR